MKQIILFLSFFVLLGTVKLPSDVVVYLAPGYSTDADGKDIQLTVENLNDPGFPKPKNHLPVLFVHDHNFGSGKNFQKNWQQSFNDLPSFRETLELAENSWLGIEPYYIDLEDDKDAQKKKNQSIEEDARKIKEALELILLHQDDPGAKNKKVVIIAYGSGSISTRCCLKELWERQNKRLSFHPVSEFIAISPPNHGLNTSYKFIKTIARDSLALKQLNNGCDENCNPFSDPRSQHFIEKLNGHAMQDTKTTNYCGQIFDSEAPGSRRNNEPIENGILYVTLYAKGNRDIVGGSNPSDDCQGRVLAKNLAPNAVNIEVPGIPGGSDKIAVHQNTVHMPEVICKALYTAVFHQAPPDELIFKCSDEKDRKSPPIVPQLQTPQQEEGIVLLFDISGSMSLHLTPAKRAAEFFIKLLTTDYRYRKTNVGIAVFPSLPWNQRKECSSQVIYPMTPVIETSIDKTIKTLNCLKAQGNTPLLNGIDTALQMFGKENHKTIVLLSDGNHNCPSIVNTNDDAVKKRIKALAEKQVRVYAIGFGSHIDLNHRLLRKLAEERTSIFTDVLKLEEVKDAMGCSVITDSPLKMKTRFDKTFYETGDTITFSAALTEGEHSVTTLTDVYVEVTRPVEGPGNWYASNKVSTEELETIPGKIGGDSITKLHRKAMFLTQTQTRKVPFPRRTGPARLHLYDNGTHGDKKKGDGIYTNQYKETKKEGTYSFRFCAVGDKFKWEKKVQKYVTIEPHPGYSILDIRWCDIFRYHGVQYLYDVELIPRDPYGNYIEPGYRVEVKIIYKHEKESNHSIRLKDNLDGTYKGKISISRSGLKTGVRLVFFINGKTFTTLEKIPSFKKWSLGIHAGGSIPAPSLSREWSPGINLGCNVGYRLSPQFSLVGLLGYNHFRLKSSSPLSGERLWWNISGNLKSEIVKNPFRVYFNTGFGIYISETGAVKPGINCGAGTAYSLKSNWVIELGADFHRVYTKALGPNFFVTYARLVYRL